MLCICYYGCTIKDIFIGTDTIKGYLTAMAKISIGEQMIDPCKTEYGAWAPLVQKILLVILIFFHLFLERSLTN